jgi:predicted nuclease of restriction endonuclease-like (RecB) superfamily
MNQEILPSAYAELLEELKQRIRTARIRAALSVNRGLIRLYWEIGKAILERQKEQGWGAKVVSRLADDLRREFPDMQGLSRANLSYMRAFAEAYPDEQFVQQVVGQLPWGHNIIIFTKLKDPALREWYIRACIEYGWSRAVLEAQIETRLHERKGRALTNFTASLPAPQSELAQQLMKDPYALEFIAAHEALREHELHKRLLERLRDFMLELGAGFAFVGSQYPIEVGGEEFYIDMLFYHLHLRCYVVVELKTTPFKPEYAGKLNFYLSVVDDKLRHPTDNPSIGILLCKSKNKVVVEYAIRDINKPMGVAEYRLGEALPEHLRSTLPTVEQLEAELQRLEAPQEAEDESCE